MMFKSALTRSGHTLACGVARVGFAAQHLKDVLATYWQENVYAPY
jgi:hypothetical protein